MAKGTGKGTGMLSVRIDHDTFTKFGKYTKDHPHYTQAGIVDSLIKYFMNQTDEQKQLLVMGVGTNYVDQLGEALQLVTWGDHAFNGYRNISSTYRSSRGSYLPWVIEIYNKLNTISMGVKDTAKKPASSSDELTGNLHLRRIAWFKLGSAWIALASELRKQALLDLDARFKAGKLQSNSATLESESDDWTNLYDVAIDSLRVALANYGLFNKSLKQHKKDPHRIVLYNQACTWSLVAQYLTEQTSNKEELKELAGDERKKEDSRLVATKPIMCFMSPGNRKVDDALSKANKCLQEVTIFNDHPERKTDDKPFADDMPFADAQWLFDYANVDSDIAFFRAERNDNFENWLSKRKGISLLDSFKGFHRNLPRDIKNFLSSEFPDA